MPSRPPSSARGCCASREWAPGRWA
jgi:hypothetical protein